MGKNNIRLLKYCAGILLFGIVLYHSVTVQRLDAVRSVAAPENFDPTAYVRDFWENKLPGAVGQAADAAVLLDLFQTDMPRAVEQYAKTLGIASLHAYLLYGEGMITELAESGIIVSIDGDNVGDILLVTLDLFGNAVRDASGMIDINDFPSTMEFNTISVEINSIVRTEVVKPALDKAAIGDLVEFAGAVEVSEDGAPDLPLPIIPININWKE